MSVHEIACSRLTAFGELIHEKVHAAHSDFPLFMSVKSMKDEDGISINIFWKSRKGLFCAKPTHHHPILIRQVFFLLPEVDSSLVLLSEFLETEKVYCEKLLQML